MSTGRTLRDRAFRRHATASTTAGDRCSLSRSPVSIRISFGSWDYRFVHLRMQCKAQDSDPYGPERSGFGTWEASSRGGRQPGVVRGVSRGGPDSRVGQVTGYASRHSAAPLPTTPLISAFPGARGVWKPTPLWWTPRGDSQFPRGSHELTHHVWWSWPCRRPISAA